MFTAKDARSLLLSPDEAKISSILIAIEQAARDQKRQLSTELGYSMDYTKDLDLWNVASCNDGTASGYIHTPFLYSAYEKLKELGFKVSFVVKRRPNVEYVIGGIIDGYTLIKW